jgi:hypothetical protein
MTSTNAHVAVNNLSYLGHYSLTISAALTRAFPD